jgi:hypothetical protein
VAVVGDDPVATARVALGLARGQALRRHVALGDLFEDDSPLAAFGDPDDPHGIADAFLYGVSLNRIAQPIDESGNLHLLRPGSETPLQEEVLGADRWRRLAGGFREVGALLIVAGPADAAHMDRLVRMLDGIVLVGGVLPPAEEAPVLAELRVADRAPAVRRPPTVLTPARGASRRAPRIAALVLLLIAALGALAWMRRDDIVQAWERMRTAPPSATSPTDSAPTSAAADSVAAAGDTLPRLVIANPQDSAIASAWTVEMVAMNTIEGAMLRVLALGDSVPATTFAPKLVGGDTPWFTVFAGASSRRQPVDSLLARLREHGVLAPGAGLVTRAPLALHVAVAGRSAAAALIETWRARGVPAYGLLQPDTTVTIYAGAFETEQQAALLARVLRSANIEATLVYRVGSNF